MDVPKSVCVLSPFALFAGVLLADILAVLTPLPDPSNTSGPVRVGRLLCPN